MPLGFANPTSSRNAAEVLGEDGDSTFSNVLRFLGRPGFAFRSLISGDPLGAAKNVGQMFLDLPTGGFISKDYSLANLFDEDGDITTDKERPEATDLLYRWGADSAQSRSFGANLAIDIGLGTLTDPLTLLTGPAKGLAQGSLKGAGRVAAQRATLEALQQAPKGLAALEKAVPEVFGQVLGRVRGAPGGAGPVKQTALARRLAEKGVTLEDVRNGAVDPTILSPVRAAALQRGLAQRAAEDVFWKTAQAGPGKFAEDIALAGHLDNGIAALEREALTRNPSALAWRIPFTEVGGDVMPGFWSKVGRYGTAPGWVRGLAGIGGDGKVAALMDGAYDQAFDWIKGLYDKTLRGAVPEAMRHYLRGEVNTRASKSLVTQRRTLEGFGHLDDAARQTLGKKVDEFQDLWSKALEDPVAVFARFQHTAPREGQERLAKWLADEAIDTPARVDTAEVIRIGTAPLDDINAGPRLTTQSDLGARALRRMEAPPPQGLDYLDELARDAEIRQQGIPPGSTDIPSAVPTGIPAPPGAGPAPVVRPEPPKLGDYTDKVMRITRDGKVPAVKDLQAFLEQQLRKEAGPDASKALDVYFTDMRAARKELIQEFPKQWHDLLANPFYMPRQIEPLFMELLGESMKDKTLAAALLDARKYGNSGDFQAELWKIAKRFGIEPEMIPGASGVQDTDLGRLYRERMLAQHHAVMKARISKKAERLGMVEGDDLHKYLTAQFAPTQIKDSTIHTILSGGELRMPFAKGNAAAIQWAKSYDPKKHLFKRRIDPTTGEIRVAIPGLSAIWKPMLTSQPQNVGFHVRNVMSAVFMGAFDPDIGLSASKTIFQSTLNGGLIQALRGQGYGGDELAEVARYLSTDPGVSGAALERLVASGKRVGSYDWKTVAKTLDAAAGSRVSQSDLLSSVGSVDALGRELIMGLSDVKGLGSGLRAAWQNWTHLGQQIAGGTEQAFRANATLHLLKKGVDPTEVVRRVNRAFVNYGINSTAERWLRDTIPFLRFTIGSGGWAKQIASSPRLVNWMGRAQGSAENSLGENQTLPERAKESLALPLPWKDAEGNMQFLLGLGLPVETTINLMGLGTATGIRRQILGGLQPALRAPLEKITNRSFYFGGEFGEYRKAPAWMPKGLTQEVKLPDGSTRYEIRGEINELFNALPTSRLDSMINKIVDSNANNWSTLINVVTGARVQTVDVEAELKKRLEGYLSEKARTGQVGEALVYFSRMDPETMPEDLKIVLGELQAVKKAKQQGRRRGFANSP